MKFQVKRTSNYDDEQIVEIDTLEDFVKWVSEQTDSVIISRDGTELEIYDQYRE